MSHAIIRKLNILKYNIENIKNQDRGENKKMNNPIKTLTKKEWILWGISLAVVIISNLATSLTMLRSSYYAVGYAANDIVLVLMWILASLENPGYIPVAVNFIIFFLNDMYGFVSWKKREVQQA